MTTKKINNSKLYPELVNLNNVTPSPSPMNVNTPNTKSKTTVKNSRLSTVRTRVAKPLLKTKTTVENSRLSTVGTRVAKPLPKTKTTAKKIATTAAKKVATKENRNAANVNNLVKRVNKINLSRTTGKRKISPTSIDQRSTKYPLTNMTNFKYNNVSKIVKFKLPLKYAMQMKKLWDKSNKEMIEYAGVLKVEHTTKNLHYLRFKKLKTATSYQRGEVSGSAAQLATTEFVSMHSHPSFDKAGLIFDSPTKGLYFTTPSDGDFNFYLASLANKNKKNHCNIVLDKHGFWVVDLLKNLETGKIFDGMEVYKRIIELLEPTLLTKAGIGKRLAKSVISTDNFLYWKCPNISTWLTLTRMVSKIILNEYDINMKYYFWPQTNINLSYREAELRFRIA